MHKPATPRQPRGIQIRLTPVHSKLVRQVAAAGRWSNAHAAEELLCVAACAIKDPNRPNIAARIMHITLGNSTASVAHE